MAKPITAATALYTYAATLRRVVDGDTYILDIDLGFRVWMTAPVRIYRFNAPEMSTPEGQPAKDAAEALFAAAKLITVHSRKAESYQRVLGDVYLDGVSIADTLIGQGHGVRTN